MTVTDWLGARTPRPPAALTARMREVLGDHGARPSADATEVLLAAGEGLTARLLRENATSRDSALDLLAADALVTYAFEAAAARPDSIPHLAAMAMQRIAAAGTAGAA